MSRAKEAKLMAYECPFCNGWHVGQTIPDELALDGAETRKGGRTVRYTEPVGTHPSVADVIARLAAEVHA